MKVPEFVKRVGWVTLMVFTLVIVIYALCKMDVENPGLPAPLLSFAKNILGAKPQLEFITDLSVFLGVILAMAVPLGIDIVQKISQFYAGSRIIRERLLREKQMQWMLPLYLVTILLSLTSRFFFIEDTTHPELQRAVCYVLLILLFSGLIIFAWYLNRLYFYTLDPKGLKHEIENRLTGSIDKRKQPDYLDLIEAYGDLIVSETRSSNLRTVMDESLPFVEAKVKQIVPKGDLEDAEKFILSQEFYEVSNRGKKQKSEGKPVTNDTTEEAAADTIVAGMDEKKVDWEQEARFRLYFSPDRYMLVYLSTIQQIIRVHQEGLRTGNDELTSQAVYSLVRILDYFSKQEERGFYIELLLRRLHEVARQAAKANDRSMYAAASQWYTTVAFDKLGTDKEEFQLDYLVTFNQALYSTLKFIIDDNYKTLFAAFVSYLVDGLHEPYRSNTVWELGHLPMEENFQKYRDSGKVDEIEKITKELENSMSSVSTTEQVRNWQGRLKELRKVVRPLLSPDGKQKADKLADELSRDMEEVYKHANLRALIFSLGAYCMFRKRYDFVKEIFDYKQPADSDASWGGNDIQPETASGVVNFYFRQGLFQRNMNFWEGHHGSELYAKRYFLCLLLRAISRNPNDNAQLADLTPSRLSDVTYSIDGLKQIANDIQDDGELITAMEIDENLINSKLIPTLDSLNTQAKAKLQAIENNKALSLTKVKEFRDEVAEAHSKESHVRSIFGHYGKLVDETAKKYGGETQLYGISRVDEKAVFFDDWYVSYGDWGKTYGSDLARSENLYLFEEIKKKSRTSETIDTIEKAVKNCAQPVILAPTRSLFRYEDTDKFIPQWRGAEIDIPEAKLDSFAGVYKVGKKQIPVFEVSYLSRSESEVVVIDTKAMPDLSILSPLGNDDQGAARTGGLSISVRAFSENTELLERYIANPPKWLTDVGDETAQRSYLMSRVLIQVFERFELTEKRSKFGYIVGVRKDV